MALSVAHVKAARHVRRWHGHRVALLRRVVLLRRLEEALRLPPLVEVLLDGVELVLSGEVPCNKGEGWVRGSRRRSLDPRGEEKGAEQVSQQVDCLPSSSIPVGTRQSSASESTAALAMRTAEAGLTGIRSRDDKRAKAER